MIESIIGLAMLLGLGCLIYGGQRETYIVLTPVEDEESPDGDGFDYVVKTQPQVYTWPPADRDGES